MSGINRFTIDSQKSNQIVGIFNETVCGLVFDISKRSNVFGKFPLARQNYENGRICELSSMDDVIASGITEDGIMNGVPYYHLNHFFTMASKDSSPHTIYVVFENCKSNFQVFNRMMQVTNKKIFQFGLWTEQDMFAYYGDQLISPFFTQLNEDLFPYKGETPDSEEYDLDIPFNVLVCANPTRTQLLDTVVYLTDEHGQRLKKEDGGYLLGNIKPNDQTFTYRTLPSITEYNIPALTVLLGQERSDQVHAMQAKNVNGTPVGCIGAALGVMTLCPVEYCLADNYLFSLRDIIPEAELGFGDDYTPMEKLGYIRRNALDIAGYVFLTDKDGYIGETFFSSDKTLGNRDYSTLVRCRTINKVQRIVRNTLLRQSNNSLHIDPETGMISQTIAKSIMNEIYDAIDTYMGIGSSLKGAAQLDYRRITIPLEQDLQNNIILKAEVEVRPGNHVESIKFVAETSTS